MKVIKKKNWVISRIRRAISSAKLKQEKKSNKFLDRQLKRKDRSQKNTIDTLSRSWEAEKNTLNNTILSTELELQEILEENRSLKKIYRERIQFVNDLVADINMIFKERSLKEQEVLKRLSELIDNKETLKFIRSKLHSHELEAAKVDKLLLVDDTRRKKVLKKQLKRIDKKEEKEREKLLKINGNGNGDSKQIEDGTKRNTAYQ